MSQTENNKPYRLEVVAKNGITTIGCHCTTQLTVEGSLLQPDKVILSLTDVKELRKDLYDCMVKMYQSYSNDVPFRDKRQERVPLYTIPWLKLEMDRLMAQENYEQAVGLKSLITFLRKCEKQGIDTTLEIASPYPSRLHMV